MDEESSASTTISRAWRRKRRRRHAISGRSMSMPKGPFHRGGELSAERDHINVLRLRTLRECLLEAKLPSDKVAVIDKMESLMKSGEFEEIAPVDQAQKEVEKQQESSEALKKRIAEMESRRDALALDALKQAVCIRDIEEAMEKVSGNMKEMQERIADIVHNQRKQPLSMRHHHLFQKALTKRKREIRNLRGRVEKSKMDMARHTAEHLAAKKMQAAAKHAHDKIVCDIVQLEGLRMRKEIEEKEEHRRAREKASKTDYLKLRQMRIANRHKLRKEKHRNAQKRSLLAMKAREEKEKMAMDILRAREENQRRKKERRQAALVSKARKTVSKRLRKAEAELASPPLTPKRDKRGGGTSPSRQRRISSPQPLKQTETRQPQVHDSVVVNFMGGGIWYPATVLAVHEKCGMIDVRFADDGECEHAVRQEHYRFLDNKERTMYVRRRASIVNAGAAEATASSSLATHSGGVQQDSNNTADEEEKEDEIDPETLLTIARGTSLHTHWGEAFRAKWDKKTENYLKDIGITWKDFIKNATEEERLRTHAQALEAHHELQALSAKSPIAPRYDHDTFYYDYSFLDTIFQQPANAFHESRRFWISPSSQPKPVLPLDEFGVEKQEQQMENEEKEEKSSIGRSLMASLEPTKFDSKGLPLRSERISQKLRQRWTRKIESEKKRDAKFSLNVTLFRALKQLQR
eukprot:g4061.t1